MRFVTVAAVLVAFTAFADQVPPEKIAKIRAEQKAAKEAIDKKYEGKKLTTAERKAVDQEKMDAANKVLDSNGVDGKSFSRSEATMNKSDRATAEATEKGIEKKAADDAKAADDKKKADEAKGKEIVVEKGSGKGKGKGGAGGPPPGGPDSDAAEAAAADREAGLGKGK